MISLKDHIKNKTQINANGCWEWCGHIKNNGYGLSILNGTSKLAHRLSWEVYNGKIPPRSYVVHECDNIICVNPDHLEVVDAKGLALRRGTHMMFESSEYQAWRGMRFRCQNPKATHYRHYGGRGIKVAPEFESFEYFISHIGRKPSPNHSLDRINNNGHYEPGNVRWATKLEQQANRRVTRTIKVANQDMTVPDFCDLYKKDRSTVYKKLKKGYSVERILNGKPGNPRGRFK